MQRHIAMDVDTKVHGNLYRCVLHVIHDTLACRRRKLRPHANSLNISVASQPCKMLNINDRELEMNEPVFPGCSRCVEGRLLNILEN